MNDEIATPTERGHELDALAKYAAWTECTDRCEDPSQHHFFANGGGFVWRWPQVHVYKPADTCPRAVWNRYPHNIIGVAVVLFGRCWGVTWKGSPKRKKPTSRCPFRRAGRRCQRRVGHRWFHLRFGLLRFDAWHPEGSDGR